MSEFLSQEEIDALLGKRDAETPPEHAEGTGSPGRRQTAEGDPDPDHPPNLEMILDFPLNISVRLGEVEKRLEEIRQISPGKVIELDRLVSEPVDVFINGKLIAHGEVVVVGENFGIRITSIVEPVERIRKLR